MFIMWKEIDIDMMFFTTLNFFNVDDEYRMKYSSHAEVEAGGIIGIIGFCVFLFLDLLLDSQVAYSCNQNEKLWLNKSMEKRKGLN